MATPPHADREPTSQRHPGRLSERLAAARISFASIIAGVFLGELTRRIALRGVGQSYRIAIELMVILIVLVLLFVIGPKLGSRHGIDKRKPNI
jgi:hypothetical protein